MFSLCHSFHLVFWVKSDLGRACRFYLAGWLMPVSDVSHLFWGFEAERHEGANRRQIFFYLFFFPQFWGCSDCRRRVSQVDEADNYAWTPDTEKMSFDPGHLACSYVSVINILSFGIPQKRSSGATSLVSNTLRVACVVWKCWLEWQEKPKWLRSMELLLSLFSEKTLRVSTGC